MYLIATNLQAFLCRIFQVVTVEQTQKLKWISLFPSKSRNENWTAHLAPSLKLFVQIISESRKISFVDDNKI